MKILFMGTPAFARVILQEVIKDFEVIGLFCQPDKPFGRKQELKAPETKEFLQNYDSKIPIYQPIEFDEVILQEIKKLNPDVILVVAYGKILPKSVLEYRCINIHASILPKYRGASPIQEMLLHNDRIFGVSAMLMEEGLDSGDILGFSMIENTLQENLLSLSEKLAFLGADLIKDVLKRLDSIKPLKQSNAQASYCKKIKKDAGEVAFVNAEEIVLKYRAFGVWPSVFLKSGLKLFDVSLVKKEGSFKSGEILDIQNDGIEVGCERGSIKIGALQAPSKQKVSSNVYLMGKRLSVGMLLE